MVCATKASGCVLFPRGFPGETRPSNAIVNDGQRNFRAPRRLQVSRECAGDFHALELIRLVRGEHLEDRRSPAGHFLMFCRTSSNGIELAEKQASSAVSRSWMAEKNGSRLAIYFCPRNIPTTRS
jgi:hypothetical protein